MSIMIFLASVAAIALWAVGIYNSLVALRNDFKKYFAHIDVQLKRRYDLIPNLVETAKGYMKHEKETLEAVISARNQAVTANNKAAQSPEDAEAMKGLLNAEGALGASLTKFFALSEAYPDLKANQNMMQLSQELSGTENMISEARKDYNQAVTTYNTKREIFPNILIANNFGFQSAQLFEITNPVEKEAIKVSF